MRKWDNPEYQRIVQIEPTDHSLAVTFGDGTVAVVEMNRLVPPGIASPDWPSLRFDTSEITVPAKPTELEIPWTRIRLLTDDSFAAYWVGAAEEEAKAIGAQLRTLRKKRGLSSKRVAESAGISPQSLSRIEHGKHDVVYTTLKKILAAMDFGLADLASISDDTTGVTSVNELVKRLQAAGVRSDLVMGRIIPQSLLARIQEVQGDETGVHASELASYVSRVFGWDLPELLARDALTLDRSRVNAAFYKAPGRTNEAQATAYAVFAHYISLLVLQATEYISSTSLPDSEDELVQEIETARGASGFEEMLAFVWGKGIPVLPLRDSGAFHGACWRVNGRRVIVLKQVTDYQARWLFDLTHELFHVFRHLTSARSALLELQEISPFDSDTKQEREASAFATRVLLADRAEDIAELCVVAARGRLERLKGAVPKVAARSNIRADVLANYLAYRLSRQNENWWGAANNLQSASPSPFETARRALIEKMDLSKLDPVDQGLLLRAIG